MNPFIWIVQLIVGLIVFACLLFLVYVTTKYIGQKASSSMKGKNMKVVESISLGIDKNVYLIRVGEKSFLIGSSGRNLQFLSEVELEIKSDDQTIEQPDTGKAFEKYLDKFLGKVKSVYISKAHNEQQSAKSTNNINIRKNAMKMHHYAELLKTNSRGGDEKTNE